MRQFRFDGVPLHAVLIHFPVSAWTIAFVTDLLFSATGSTFLWMTSLWLLWLGALMGLAAIVAGYSEFVALRDNPGAARWTRIHMRWSGLAWLAFLASAILHGLTPPAATPWMLLGIDLAGLLLLARGAHVGARMVYGYGVGTGAAPAAEPSSEG